jgi:hypothetical protein
MIKNNGVCPGFFSESGAEFYMCFYMDYCCRERENLPSTILFPSAQVQVIFRTA